MGPEGRQEIAAAKSLPGSASCCVARSTGLCSCLAYPDDVGHNRQVGHRGAQGRERKSLPVITYAPHSTILSAPILWQIYFRCRQQYIPCPGQLSMRSSTINPFFFSNSCAKSEGSICRDTHSSTWWLDTWLPLRLTPSLKYSFDLLCAVQAVWQPPLRGNTRTRVSEPHNHTIFTMQDACSKKRAFDSLIILIRSASPAHRVQSSK